MCKRLTRTVMSVLLIVSPLALSQTPEDIVNWSAKAPKSASPGAHITVQLVAHIRDGWHIYSVSQPPGGPTTTVISFPNKLFQIAGQLKTPVPQHSFDPNFNLETETHEGLIRYTIPVSVDGATPSGAQRIAIDILYQTCDETNCLPPYSKHLSIPIMVAGVTASQSQADPSTEAKLIGMPTGTGAATANQGTAPTNGASTAPNGHAGSASTFIASGSIRAVSLEAFLWLAMGMGALSLLTPCVFPMVPITVSYFSNYGSETKRGAIIHALIYGVGIVLTFSALGLSLALIFGAAGVNQLAANPWVNLVITAVFLAFAFSLFGAYLINVPSRWMNRMDALTRGREGSKVIGALLMGFTFSLTSFTCTAPFVGTLLVMASQGSWRWPLIGLLAYSIVFALPFVALAMVPQMLSRLPRSGAWMNSVKVVMGFIEIAAAMKFLSNADLVWGWGFFTRQAVLAVWIACGIAICCYIVGLFRLNHDTPIEHIGALRLSMALIAMSMTIALIPGLFGKALGELDSFLPPPLPEVTGGATRVISRSDDVEWTMNDYAGALARAKQENKPVFIDFTGFTCTNCRWMEANMFPRPEIQSQLKKFITLRLYTDGRSPIYEGQQRMEQEKFNTIALPLYAIVRPDGTTVSTFSGLTRDSTMFLAFLRKA